MILFGGTPNGGSSTFNDVWVLTNADGQGAPGWVNLVPNGAPNSPSPREGAPAIYDTASNRLALYGGDTSCPPFFTCTYPDDAWMLQNANGLGGLPIWTKLNPAGPLPPARRYHTATYDFGSNRMTVFGGDHSGPGSTVFNDTWILTNPNGLSGSALQVSSVVPDHGGNAGSVTPLIVGSSFLAGTQVKLVTPGQPDILGSNGQVLTPGTLRVTFDMLGAAPGVRDVVATNPDGTSVTLKAAYTVRRVSSTLRHLA